MKREIIVQQVLGANVIASVKGRATAYVIGDDPYEAVVKLMKNFPMLFKREISPCFGQRIPTCSFQRIDVLEKWQEMYGENSDTVRKARSVAWLIIIDMLRSAGSLLYDDVLVEIRQIQGSSGVLFQKEFYLEFDDVWQEACSICALSIEEFEEKFKNIID